MFRGITATLVAVGTIWGLAERTEAFHHVVRARCIAYYPGLYSYGYCGCPPYPPPPYTFPCTWSYPNYCAGQCWNGTLTCGSGRHGCCLGHKLHRWHASCLARKAARRSACGYGYCGADGCGYANCGYGDCGYGDCGSGGGCYDGCGSSCGYGGACGDGGCVGGDCVGGGCVGGDCVDGQIGSAPAAGQPYEVDEKVLYDGPAPAPAPGQQAPPTPEPDPSAALGRTPFQLTSSVEGEGQRDGSNEFARGLRAFWNDNMTEAMQAFEMAAAAEPSNALYHYYRALALYNISGADAAGDWLNQAVELERREPVANWGRRMERVQGQQRLWVERARQNAGLKR